MLTNHFGWFSTFIAWISAINLAMKFVEGVWQRKMEAWITSVAESTDQNDDRMLTSLLGSKRWITISFVARFLNFWLPTLSDYEKEKNKYAVVLQKLQAVDTTNQHPQA